MNRGDPGAGERPRQLPRGLQLGAILWPSFFAAGIATMVLFGLFDPVELFDLAFPGRTISRQLGYTLGFFLLWTATAAASLFTWILLRPGDSYNRSPPHP
jgi:hypothetical protein